MTIVFTKTINQSILYCLLLIINVLPIATFSQSKEIKKMLIVLREQERTWSSRDIEGYVNLYAPHDSTRMILSKGAAYGKENILAFYKKNWPKEKMGTLKLDGEQFEKLSRRFYYVTGYFHVSYPDGKKIEGRYSSLMKKIKGRWYIYTDRSG
jgi:ketosteroid isomerase-like protein